MKCKSNSISLVKEYILLVLMATVFIVLALRNISYAAGNISIVPVPRNVIFSGQLIDESLLTTREVPTGYLRGRSVLVSNLQIIGMEARRTLMPNKPIFSNSVTSPDVVKVNRPTIMEYSYGTLKITAEVVPLMSAKKGEFVRARNIHSGAIVAGVAQADGMILAQIIR